MSRKKKSDQNDKSNPIKWKDYGALSRKPVPTKEKAYLLYQMYRSVEEISRETNHTPKTIRNWIEEEKWEHERGKISRQLLTEQFEKAVLNAGKTVDVSLTLVYQSVLHRYKQSISTDGRFTNPLTIQEMRQIISIVSDLDKLMRLSVNAPTEHVALDVMTQPDKKEAHYPLTIKDLYAAFVKDQMMSGEPNHTEVVELEKDAYGSARTENSSTVEKLGGNPHLNHATRVDATNLTTRDSGAATGSNEVGIGDDQNRTINDPFNCIN